MPSTLEVDACRTAGESDTDHEPSITQPQSMPPAHVITSPFVRGTEHLPSELDNPEWGDNRTALVILNAPIPKHHNASDGTAVGTVFDRLWHMSSYRVCADGGANRLYGARWGSTPAGDNADDDKAFASASSPSCDDGPGGNIQRYVPNLIVGDLDSLYPTIRRHYEGQGCQVRHVHDQDRNDLDKALDAVRDEDLLRRRTTVPHSPQAGGDNDDDVDVDDDRVDRPFRHVVVYGAFGGRFDQEMASLQALYKWGDQFGGANVWLYNENTCACLLQPHNVRNVITVCPEVENLASVGLIPLGGRCDRVYTSGFRWNLNGDAMEFGGLVSTSNEMTEPTVTVQATHRLVFTAAVRSGAPNEWDEASIIETA